MIARSRGGWIALATAAVALALAGLTPAQSSISFRAYELDLTGLTTDGGFDPVSFPMPPEELARELKARGFDAIVLWIPPDEPGAEALPAEPRARIVAKDALSGRVAYVTAAFTQASLRVAVGRRAMADVASIPPVPVDPTIEIEQAGAAPMTLPRVRRPAVRRYLFSLPGALRASVPANSKELALSSRLVAPTVPELRALQTRLDLEGCASGPAGGEAASPSPRSVLEFQSAIARHLATRLRADAPEAHLPFENEWLGARSRERLPPLRRAPPLLDLEEWCFSHPSILADCLSEPARVEPWTEADATETSPPEVASRPTAPTVDGQLTLEQCRAFVGLVAARGKALAPYMKHMAFGDQAARAECRAALAQLEPRIAQIGPLEPFWNATLAADAALLDAAEPWRVRFTRWTIASASLSAPREASLARVDDPRLGNWAARVEELLGGRALDLWKFLAVERGVEVTLRTELSLRDPRNVRLMVDARATRTVRVNGGVVVDRFPNDRGPLLTTLSLPAGTSTVEVALVLDGTSGEAGVELDFVPNRVEGIVLPARNAVRVNEPVVRLRDPTALDETCLVRPAGRVVNTGASASASSAGSGFARASFPFPLGNSGRFDVWCHVLPLADRPSTLDFALDERAVIPFELPTGSSWAWFRLPGPLTIAPGDHALHVGFPAENVRVDQLLLLASELTLPRTPAGNASFGSTAWRFDPLGAGVVVDLPTLRGGELFGRAFSLDQGGSYQPYVWLKGSDPLAPGQWSELELTSPSGRQRFVLPAGTPYEEWVPLGDVIFVAGERIELRAHGHGALARVALLRE